MQIKVFLVVLFALAFAVACGGTTPTAVPPTAAPTTAPQPTAVPPTATNVPPTATSAPTVSPGVAAADVEKLVNDKFNKVDRTLALWNIQPGLGTVMIEYANRLARLWFAGNAGNWDMAKYQHDEMLEIQEVGETTRPARAPLLKGFEATYMDPIDKAITAKDKAAFIQAVTAAVDGCNTCHASSTGAAATTGYTWKSYQYVKVELPKIDPASYVDWKGGGQDSYVASAVAPTATPKPPLTGTLDAAGVEKYINSKLNVVDRTLGLGGIQPGLGTVMIEYGNRFSRLYFSAKAGNWDMAKYQHDEMLEIQEVGETTRPGRAPMLKGFEATYLDPLDKAIAAKDAKAFDAAYTAAVSGCNTCHAGSTGAAATAGYTWNSYKFVKVQVPTTDNNDYIVWNVAKGTGSYAANASVAPTATPKPPLTGVLDMAGVTKLFTDKLNTVDRSLAMWNIQPGLGTVMIEYARRFAQLNSAITAGNFDMSKYQLDEMLEIQEVGETTRPARAPLLKNFEDGSLKPLDAAILAKDKDKAMAAWKTALTGCNACHTASTGTAMDPAYKWTSYGWIQIQAPPTNPADYVQWNAGNGNTGNYITTP